MSKFKMTACALILLALPLLAIATEAAPEPSVEDNIRSMDKDSNGMVTVYEVRALIEDKHGKDYQKDTLDRLEATANGTSCATPFAKPMY